MRIIGIVVVCLTLCGSAYGQSTNAVSASVVIQEKSFYVGSPFSATLVAKGLVPPVQISAASTEGFWVYPVSAVTNQQGRYSQVVALYQIVPKKSGALTLPTFSLAGMERDVTAGGRVLAVQEPELSPKLMLSSHLSTSRCYVGQPVTVTYRVKIELPLQEVRAMDVQAPFLMKNGLEVFDSVVSTSKALENTIGLPVNQARVIARREGDQMIFSRTLVPRVSGTYTSEGARLLCSTTPGRGRTQRSGFQYPSYFDNQFFKKRMGGVAYRRLFTRAKDLRLEVLPLPVKGRPAGFSGIVGEFDLVASLDRDHVQVGEPLELSLAVSGYTHPEAIMLPSLGAQRGLVRRFRLSFDELPGVREGRDVVFRYSIRPRSPRTDRLPSIRIDYFDPVAMAYGVATTTVVTVSVREADVADGSDAVLSDGTILTQATKGERDGPRGLMTGRGLLVSQLRVDSFAGIRWIWILVLPPLLYLGLVWRSSDYRLRRSDFGTWRARHAFRLFRKSVAGLRDGHLTSDEWTRIELAVRTYFAAHVNGRPAAMTESDIRTVLARAQVPRSVREELRAYLEECDFVSFSGRAREGVRDVSGLFELIRGIEGRLVKVSICLMLVGILGVGAGVMDEPEHAPLLRLAQGLYDEAELAVDYDPIAADALFTQAAACYGPAVESVFHRNGLLYYNQGTCLFRGGDLGGAMVSYLTAAEYIPRHPDLRHNLGLLRSQLESQQFVSDVGIDWAGGLRAVSEWIPVRILALGLSVLYAACFCLLGLQLFLGPNCLRSSLRATVGVGVFGGLILGAAVLSHGHRAVVSTFVVPVSSPMLYSAAADGQALSAGSEVRVIRSEGNWREIRMAGRDSVWVDEAALSVLP